MSDLEEHELEKSDHYNDEVEKPKGEKVPVHFCRLIADIQRNCQIADSDAHDPRNL